MSHPDDAFVWPPRAHAAEPLDVDLPGPIDDLPGGTLEATGAIGVLVRAERDLLGVRSLSFANWARSTGWEPEPTRGSCWRCAGSVGPFEVDGDGCGACRERRLAWSRAVRLGGFDGGLRTAVLELKFGRWRRTGRELGWALGERIRSELDEIGVDPGEACLVPVPTTARRRLARGIDHTLVLARGATESSGIPVCRALRRRHGRAQVGLSATARAANVRGAFLGVPGRAGWLAERRVIVVLDDVRTTGATLTAACRAVRGVVKGAAKGNGGTGGEAPLLWGAVACVASDRRRDGAF